MPNRFVINIRGAGGSGKTTLVRHVLAHQVEELSPVWTHQVRPGGSKGPSKEASWPVYKCQVPGIELPIYVQGSYKQAQGGCDTCKDTDAIEAIIWRAATELTDGHVLFEGMMVSGSAGRWAEFATRVRMKLSPTLFLWTFLMVDKETMVRRIMQRNGGKQPQVQYMDENIKKQVRSRNGAKMIADRCLILDLDPLQAPDVVFSQFVAEVGARERGEK